MSPFAIRRRIGFQGIRRKVELQPSIEGTVFRSFYDMVGKLEGAQAGQTPQASADAERMREHIETVLTNKKPGAFWFFLPTVRFRRPAALAWHASLSDGRAASVGVL